MCSPLRRRIILVRKGWENRERFVMLVSAIGKVSWVDPQREVSQAIGLELGRFSCILSFADGLVAAGKEVIISENFRGQVSRRVLHANRLRQEVERTKVKPIYFYLGMAWATNQWLPLKYMLQRIEQPHRRLEIFGETAEHLVEVQVKKPRPVRAKLHWAFTPDEKTLVLTRREEKRGETK